MFELANKPRNDVPPICAQIQRLHMVFVRAIIEIVRLPVRPQSKEHVAACPRDTRKLRNPGFGLIGRVIGRNSGACCHFHTAEKPLTVLLKQLGPE